MINIVTIQYQDHNTKFENNLVYHNPMWFQPGPHHVPSCGYMWKIRSGPDRNLETNWAISARETKKKYDTYEKEALAIIFCVTDFRPYLYRRKFTLVTDHKPLVWFQNSKDPC